MSFFLLFISPFERQCFDWISFCNALTQTYSKFEIRYFPSIWIYFKVTSFPNIMIKRCVEKKNEFKQNGKTSRAASWRQTNMLLSQTLLNYPSLMRWRRKLIKRREGENEWCLPSKKETERIAIKEMGKARERIGMWVIKPRLPFCYWELAFAYLLGADSRTLNSGFIRVLFGIQQYILCNIWPANCNVCAFVSSSWRKRIFENVAAYTVEIFAWNERGKIHETAFPSLSQFPLKTLTIVAFFPKKKAVKVSLL